MKKTCQPTVAADGEKIGNCGLTLVELPGGGHACPRCDGPVVQKVVEKRAA